jgi:hypothetical protein
VNDSSIYSPLPNLPQYQAPPLATPDSSEQKVHKILQKFMKQRMLKTRKLTMKAFKKLPKKKIV